MALQDLHLLAKRWNAFHEQCFGREGVLSRQGRKRENDEIPVEKVEPAISGLVEVRDAVAKERKALRLLASRLRARLGSAPMPRKRSAKKADLAAERQTKATAGRAHARKKAARGKS